MMLEWRHALTAMTERVVSRVGTSLVYINVLCIGTSMGRRRPLHWLVVGWSSFLLFRGVIT